MTSPSEIVSLTVPTSDLSPRRDRKTSHGLVRNYGCVSLVKLGEKRSRRYFSDADVEETCLRVEKAVRLRRETEKFVTYKGGQ